ncbi:MAG: hypothetical protein ABII12_14920 [Planctomycetota bacterium]
MSAIPPHSIGSILQSGVAQAEQARQTDADKNARADAANKTRGGADAVLEVEETDADTQVHAEAGGQGSQGRHDAPPEEEAEDRQANNAGVSIDDDGVPHVDISA